MALVAILWLSIISGAARAHQRADQLQDHLEQGDVVLRTECVGSTRYVDAQVLVPEPPEKVWPVLANPFEFHRNLFSRIEDLDIIVDEPRISCMKTRINCGLFPPIVYVVESKYIRNQRIDFKRKEGSFRDFSGYWLLTPSMNGASTVVTFSVFVDPGLPLPQWLIREGIKIELPRTLRKLRNRVMALCNMKEPPIQQSIAAATIEQPK
jgi:hypothetical protein